MKKCGFCLSLLFIGLFLWLKTDRIAHVETSNAIHIDVNSRAERLALAEYFAYLFCRAGFGYSLIGAKPLAIDLDFFPTPLSTNAVKEPYILSNSRNFLFKITRTNQNLRLTILIHKKKFLEVCNENKDLFQLILGRNFSSKKLLEEIETSERPLFEIIKNNETILGILLGFGRKNALLFSRMEEIALSSVNTFPIPFPSVYFSCFRQNRRLSIAPKQLNALSPFKTIDQEKAWLDTHFNQGSFSPKDVSFLDLVFPVGFRVTDSRETKKLVSKYKKARRLLIKLFSNQNCLDVVLEQLQSKKPVSF